MTELQKFTRPITGSLNTIGELLPCLIQLMIKLGLLSLFFAYLLGFALEFFSAGSWWARGAGVVVVVVVLLCLIWMIAAVVKVRSEDQTRPLPPLPVSGSIWPFVVLVVLPLLIVYVAGSWFSYSFKSALLKATQTCLHKLLA